MSLFTDYYELTMCAATLTTKTLSPQHLTSSLGGLPENRSYFLFAGLEEALAIPTNHKVHRGTLRLPKKAGVSRKTSSITCETSSLLGKCGLFPKAP